jgi:tRNA threonylcarbamoyladenosine biosynthesis protein TsaE
MKENIYTKITKSLQQTLLVGEKIGQYIYPGTVICLSGDLGSGKTTLVQGIAKGLCVSEKYYITSPTYNIINQYPGKHPLFHADLYRINSSNELDDIGFYEILNSENIVVIEWAEKLKNYISSDRIDIYMQILDDTLRKITVKLYKHNMIDFKEL